MTKLNLTYIMKGLTQLWNEIKKLYDELNNCKFNCPLKDSVKAVTGHFTGPTNITFIGEAPGEKEVEQGTPFVGIAGDNFTEFLKHLNLDRNEIFITNTVKCRPTVNNEGRKNRAPRVSELSNCFYYLEKELDIINPKLIITLGNVPLKQLLGDNKASISNWHGTLFFYKYSKVFPIHHPGAITYNPGLEDTIKEDLEVLKQLVNLQK